MAHCHVKDTPKLKELVKYVKPHAADKWEDIGIGLQLFDDSTEGEMALEEIEKKTEPFNATMRLWLKSKQSEVTWEALLVCLRDIPGLEKAVESIENNITIHKKDSENLSPGTASSSSKQGNTDSGSIPNSSSQTPGSASLSQPPISIPGPPPETIAGQPPFCISGPQEPFPLPPEPTPPQEDSTVYDDYSLKLKPGQQVRSYQWELAEPGINGKNYIVVAPTGSGKTLVAALVISEHLKKTRIVNATADWSKVIFMVNTKPLADQQQKELAQFIPRAKVECCVGDYLGSISEILPHCDIVVCTAGKLLDDLRKSKLSLSEISLMVIDECHHTKKKAPQAKIMEKYLEERKEHGAAAQLPQVIGLTASPGAGDSNNLELSTTIEHLITLCALMDASSGIKVVSKHRQELDQFTNKPSFTLEILHRRDPEEQLISVVEKEMESLELRVERGFKCSFLKWSQEYETYVQQQKQKLEISTDERLRDQISILKVLRCYSQVLNVYMDLRHLDAFSVLEEFTGLPDNDKLATPIERELKYRIDAVKTNLKMFPPVENPLLKKAEEKLVEIYSDRRESRGIVFVRTKRHAIAISEWISRLPVSAQLGLNPRVLTGHTREASSGMTLAEQQEVMKSFHEGKCNILVATSVAEEGLDVPACNLVIRFQHVSNEIAKVQTVGRARAEESEGLTILSSDSKKTIQEIKNEERLATVDKILEEGWVPSGEHLVAKLAERQHTLLRDAELKRKLKEYKRLLHSREAVQLKCKKCKTVACNGSDIFSSEATTQYTVPNKSFQEEKILIKPHHTPGRVNDNVFKTHKIYCAKCEADWGIMCVWQGEQYTFPVLKCKSFIFEVNGIPKPVAQWSKAPFEVSPLSVWIELEKGDSEESDTESD